MAIFLFIVNGRARDARHGKALQQHRAGLARTNLVRRGIRGQTTDEAEKAARGHFLINFSPVVSLEL